VPVDEAAQLGVLVDVVAPLVHYAVSVGEKSKLTEPPLAQVFRRMTCVEQNTISLQLIFVDNWRKSLLVRAKTILALN